MSSMWVQKEVWCSEGGEEEHLHARHHEDRGDHGVEVSAADGSSSVDHHWQQNLHQNSWCTIHVFPAAKTCLPFWDCIVDYWHHVHMQLCATSSCQMRWADLLAAFAGPSGQQEKGSPNWTVKAPCKLVIVKLTCVQIKKRKLTRCAPMMRPMVSAASDPAYIFAMATAPHDMKLKAACATHATIWHYVLQVSRCIKVARVK